MLKIRSLNSYMRERFGGKVYKLALDGGFGCPHRSGADGRGEGGCAFCAEGSSHFSRRFIPGTEEQLEEAKRLVAHKMGRSRPRYLAYFQAYTNTYGSPEEVAARIEPLLTKDEIVAVSLATRPDCLPDEMIAKLSELNRQKPLWIELGLQSMHEETARRMNLAYTFETFRDAVLRLHEAGLESIVHLIFGLPGEDEKMMLETVRAVSELPLQGVKLQLLHVLRGTPLAEDYARGLFRTMEEEEWFALLGKILPLLPPEMVIHRLTGDGEKNLLIAPLWTANKRQVLNHMQQYFKEHPVVQGSAFEKNTLQP